ncbi:hypothetical protein OS242_10385 [Tumebacillus sp. DT12]|uniref:Uncharacterized protein n=1 Tax=Tumebacillus lacus TaxID=2995335 RepID=A0ABT3X1Q3_9BACL|nr:hypothetical protein [Tumebacillus lacus]MCX7570371.1 hypothetical protein [Tumebacillus lacus]
MKIDLEIDYDDRVIDVREERPAPPESFATCHLLSRALIRMPDGFEDLTPAEQMTYIAIQLQKKGYGPKETDGEGA